MMILLLLFFIWTTCVSCRPLPPLHVETRLPLEMENDLEPARTTWLLDIQKSTEFLQNMPIGVIAAIPLFILLGFLIFFSIFFYYMFCHKKPET